MIITDETGITAAAFTDDEKFFLNKNKTSDKNKAELKEILKQNQDIDIEALINSKKRVRMPSSILSELYPTLPSPYYK